MGHTSMSFASQLPDEHELPAKDALTHLDADPTTLPSSLDPFTITTSNGFLPVRPPTVKLPAAFASLARVLEDMPVMKIDGSPGLLAKYELGHVIDRGVLQNLTTELDHSTTDDGQVDLAVITAIFRDYSFLASAYLLEPCWKQWKEGQQGYGLGKKILPACIAGPLMRSARMLDIPPFMSYAASYALFNYRFDDGAIGTAEYSNLRLIRAFEHGLDPTSSEAGFILTHVDMVKHSAGLVKGAVELLRAVTANDHAQMSQSFRLLLSTMQVIEQAMENMWNQSKPKDYISYRTFIFGITNQSMFPDGVIYEGENDEKPLSFRGESGANDSMIPLLDALLQIPMPQNPLTDILKDFRSYRPKPHREFLTLIRERAETLDTRKHFCENKDTAIVYLRLLDHVRSFRFRHWHFAREYIIRRSSHPTATGGSPIITWLPNQLFAVMDLMTSVWDEIGNGVDVGADIKEMMANVRDQRIKLEREVKRWCAMR